MQTEQQTIEQPAIEQPQAQPAEQPPEAQAQQEQDTSEAKAEDKADDKPRDERGRFKGVQARIDELTREKYEREREAAYWRSLALQGQQQTEQPKAAEKPQPEKFQDYAQYVEALAEWKADEKVRAALAERDQRAAEEAQQRAVQAKAQTFAERAVQVRQQIPDFDEVVGAADVQVPAHVTEVLLESDFGPQLAYHLAKNPDEAARISRLSPTAAARELGRLEARFERPAAPVEQKPVTTKAPPPMKSVQGSAQPGVKDPSRMSMDEYRAWRKSQGAGWAR